MTSEVIERSATLHGVSSRPLDLIVFGATGFTGRLVAEVLVQTRHLNGLRWGLAGRRLERLRELRAGIGAATDLPLIEADAADLAGLRRLATQARAVISTVGPYTHHGSTLVQACAEAGTDYLDLCGEPLWMRRMIEQWQATAAKSGARIVFSCGFDSIPFDIGAVFLQHQMRTRFGAPASEVRARVQWMRGTASGGTVASLMATLEQVEREPALGALMDNPFALTPGFAGPPQADPEAAVYDDWAGAWTAPFVMSAINTKNVHRTNALRGHPWGRGFVYSERLLTGKPRHPDRGRLLAHAVAGQSKVGKKLLSFRPTRQLIGRLALPQAGTGPGPEARERGGYGLLLSGRNASDQGLSVKLTGAGDPGYGSTSRLITQAALCLLNEIDHHATPGGIWTAGAAMGLALQRRLHDRAGLTFEVLP